MSITDDSKASVAGERQKTAPPIDLLTCPPDELASWLNVHRFQNNAMDVASFLLTCTAALPNAEEISAHLMGGGGEEANDDASADGEAEMKQEQSKEGTARTNNSDAKTTANNDDLGEAAPSFSSLEVSCINPRGKFLLSLHKNGIMFQNPKKTEEQITITKETVKHTVWFRKPEDYKSLKQLKEGSKKPIPGHMVLICLGDGITFRNKAMKQICFQLPSYPALSVETEEDINEEGWYNGLNSALISENKSITRVLAEMDTQTCKTKKQDYMFQAGEGSSGNTSTTTAGMPFVGCNRGFNNGALFPLREGLLFFKPPLFVPRSNLASISCGRGSGQSRFVDMVVQLDDDESTLEFTNIERDELQGLNGYIHNVLIPAMKKDAVEGSDNDGEDKDVDEDEDVAMAEVVNSSDEESESDESSGKCKRKSSRAASKSAREATRAHFAGLPECEDDEDDEDSDVGPFSEGEVDSDGSDRQSDSDLSEMDDGDDDESEEEERSDDSDDDDGSFEVERRSKKAKVD
eukprot:scaffold27070_cov147-Skeletonema_menzelii.AAC.15